MAVRAVTTCLWVVSIVAGCWGGGAHERPEMAATEAVPEARRSEPATVVWIGGDVLLSGAIRRSVRRGGDPAAGFARVLEPVARQWRADGDGAFVLVNLESPVAREVRNGNDDFLHLKRGARRVRAPLNAPRWLLGGLRAAGVDGVMLANNHALDQERDGLAETIDAAHEAGLVVTGAGRAPELDWPIVIGDGASKTTILTYLEKDFPEPDLAAGVAGLSVLGPRALDDVARAAEASAATIVVVHVVAELLAEPKPAWRQWARELADAGAAAVLFHGTHVPGPVEGLRAGGRDVVVAYGLGNFVSDMGAWASPARTFRTERARGKWDLPDARAGLLARLEVSGGTVGVSFLPIWMGHDRYLVRNGIRAADTIAFELVPLAPCGAASDPREWPEPYRREMREWLGERRDGVLATTGLDPGSCEPLLAPPALR